MTAAQAIKRECRDCIGTVQANCASATCKLHPSAYRCRSSVKRIKAHCLECAAKDAGSVHQAVRDCTGHLLRGNGNGKMCFLHPYREGHNPDRPKRTSIPPQFSGRTPCQSVFRAVGSTIPAQVIPEGGEAPR